MRQRIFTLIYKEFLAIWRDRRSRAVLIIPLFTQLFVFTFAATLDVQNASIAILNRDVGEQAFELTMRLHGAPRYFSHITYLSGVPEIAPYINNQKGPLVVSIDPQFSRNLDAGQPASLQLILDGRQSNSAQILAGYVAQIVQRFNEDFMSQQQIKQQNTVLVQRNWFNPNLIYKWFTVPNLSGVLAMIAVLIVTALSVARERELGTFDQLLVSPLSPIEIMIGKTVPALIIGIIESSIIILAAVIVFGVPFLGSAWLLYLGLIVFMVSVVGVGLFISALSSTQQQALLGTFTFVSPAVSLSGFATPVENMPEWLQIITLANPLRWYLVVVKGVMLKEMPFHIVLANTWPMAVIALFTLAGATWFFRKRLA